jgi:putative N6-adenine-specific DNA methylase
MPPARHPTFIICPPGLESLVTEELSGLPATSVPRSTAAHGGVRAALTTRQLYAANLHLRTATRIIVRVARFPAATFAAFEAGARAVDWSPWLGPDAVVAVRVSATKSRLWHTGAVAERLAGVLPAEVAHPSPDAAESAAQLVLVRIVHDEVTISVDASGEPLHRRGWRRQTAKAALRPTLAAAMLLATGWRGDTPLIDPFCGSGTIVIEAARLARGLPPGVDRSFAFERWPSFEPGTWGSVSGAARATDRGTAGVPIVARDRDAGAVEATAANAERAGVLADLDLAQAPISALRGAPAGPGWLITNPPYGRRVSRGPDLRDLYARLGQVISACLPDWHTGLLVADPVLAGHAKLSLTEAWRSTNGGLEVRYLTTPPT